VKRVGEWAGRDMKAPKKPPFLKSLWIKCLATQFPGPIREVRSVNQAREGAKDMG